MTQLSLKSRARTQNARLTKLGVAGCGGITLTGLLAISNQLICLDMETTEQSSLKSLEFTCPTPKKTSAITLNSPSPVSRFIQTLPPTIEEVTIHDAYILGHQDVICLADKLGPNLRILRLDNGNAVNSTTLAHILSVCPKLTVLCIPRATQLDDSGVAKLSTAKCAQSLIELDLSACHCLTDTCLTLLAKASPIELQDVTGSRSQETSKGKEVMDKEIEPRFLFPNLRRLDLSYNDKMTLTGIIPLVMSLKNLCALDVSFCGEGVTRSWNTTLESIRPTGVPHHHQDYEEHEDDSQDDPTSDNSISEDEASPISSPEGYVSYQYGVNSQPGLETQQSQPVSPVNVPSRPGVGRYVGPMLSRPSVTQNNATPSQQNPVEIIESDDEKQCYRRRSSASSTLAIGCFRQYP
ncbi:hypothetical protein BGZ76_010171 [Entomortierella beljakovae]|nr:hypothetical protein BGZ76_010171 [Entomortierella beljakovae]